MSDHRGTVLDVFEHLYDYVDRETTGGCDDSSTDSSTDFSTDSSTDLRAERPAAIGAGNGPTSSPCG